MADIEKFALYLVQSVSPDPSLIKVSSFEQENDDEKKELILEVVVPDDQKGVIIGKGGQTARAIRTLIQAYAYVNGGERVKVNIDSF